MSELIANLRAAYQQRIEANSWMDAATKKQALAKLAAFDPRIGHPVKYIDYTNLKMCATIRSAMRSDRRNSITSST